MDGRKWTRRKDRAKNWGQGTENYLRKNQHRKKQGKTKQQQKEIGKTTDGKIPYSC